jgi:glyoxylase-like metal-dependent hydrolase (beta-lactamase superfamily II)
VIIPVPYGDVTFFRMARTYRRRAVYWTGLHFVDGLLIDSGPPNLSGEAARLFAELSIRACATTHHHEDHTGNHALLQERFGIVPMAHPAAASLLTHPAPLQFYRRVAWGNPRPATCVPFGSSVRTERFRFRIVHTPGHAEDHVVLHEPDRGWLFTGDLYLGERQKYLRADENIHASMASLRRVIALEPRVLFCQHRGRVDQATEALRRKLAFLEDLHGRVLDLRARGLPVAEISRRLMGRDLLWRLWTAGHFSRRNVVRAILHSGAAEGD